MSKNPLQQSETIRLWSLVVFRVLALLALFFALYWLISKLRTVLLMLVLSVFFCYLIAPIVRLFEQPVYVAGRELKLPRGFAIATVYLIFGLVTFGMLQLILPILWEQITQLSTNLPSYISSASSGVSKSFNDANSWMRHLKLPREWRDWILQHSTQSIESLFPLLQNWVVGALSFVVYLPWLVLVPILSFFLLKDASRFEQSVVALVRDERLRKRVHWLLLDVSQTLAAYIRAQITACLVIGAIVTIGFGLIGVPYAVVLGLVSGLLEFIPMVGPLLAAIIAISLTLTTSFKTALVVAAFLIILRIVQDYIIYPRIVGQGIKMHPLVVVLAILSGAEIGGLTGVFLAIPFVGLIIVGYNHYLAYKGIQRIGPETDAEQVEGNIEPTLSATGPSTALLEE